MQVVRAGSPVDLPSSAFVADGGEASVFALGSVAFKVHHQPVDPQRLVALGALPVRGALLPDELLFDGAGACVGHTMRFLAGAIPWARLLARSYRDRHGVGVDQALQLVRQLRDRVHEVHRAGAVVVDLHEGNILLDARHDHPVLIDTSSWQLAGYPATAIQDNVRDRQQADFDEGTDWFSFAVVSLNLLLGIHPYRGTHPTVKGLDARMVAQLSVLRPEVKVPSVCWPPQVIPGRWRRWFEAVLDHGHRGPPPEGDVDGSSWSPLVTTVSAALELRLVLQADRPVLAVADGGGRVAACVRGGTWLDGLSTVASEAVICTPAGVAVGARREGRRLRLHDLVEDEPVAVDLVADAVAAMGEHLVVLSGGRLLQLQVRSIGATLHVLPRLLATVLPAATHLFAGLAVQNLLGRAHLLLLSAGRCDTRPVPELDGWTVLDGHHCGGVVALVARRGGQTDRFVFRFSAGGYELRRTADVETADLDLVQLASGVCCLRVGGRLELFHSKPGDDALRVIEDPAFATSRLADLSGALGLVQGCRVYRAAMKP